MQTTTITYLDGVSDYLTAEAQINDAAGTTVILASDNTQFVAEWIGE